MEVLWGLRPVASALGHSATELATTTAVFQFFFHSLRSTK
jgi:hypothetical protein